MKILGQTIVFLVEYNVSLEGCQKACTKRYDSHTGFEQEGLQEINKALTAYMGLSEEEGRALSSSLDDTLKQAAVRSKTVRRFFSISNFFFYATTVLFIAAVLLASVNVVISLYQQAGAIVVS